MNEVYLIGFYRILCIILLILLGYYTNHSEFYAVWFVLIVPLTLGLPCIPSWYRWKSAVTDFSFLSMHMKKIIENKSQHSIIIITTITTTPQSYLHGWFGCCVLNLILYLEFMKCDNLPNSIPNSRFPSDRSMRRKGNVCAIWNFFIYLYLWQSNGHHQH